MPPPLVARLGADPVFVAQSSKVLRLHGFHRKLNSLVHRFIIFPGHPAAYRLPLAPLSVTYVLNLIRYPCSEPAPKQGRSAWALPGMGAGGRLNGMSHLSRGRQVFDVEMAALRSVRALLGSSFTVAV